MSDKQEKAANDVLTSRLTQQVQMLEDQVKKLTAAHQEALDGKRQAIAMASELKEKLAEFQNEKIFAAKARKINAITKLMQEKGMIDSSPEAYKKQLTDLASMDDTGLESWKRLVLNAPSRLNPVATEKTATSKKFGNLNHTFYIPDSDQKTVEKMNPLAGGSVFDNLPWSGLPPS